MGGGTITTKNINKRKVCGNAYYCLQCIVAGHLRLPPRVANASSPALQLLICRCGAAVWRRNDACQGFPCRGRSDRGSSPLCREIIRSVILSSLPHLTCLSHRVSRRRCTMYLSIESFHRGSPQHSHRMNHAQSNFSVIGTSPLVICLRKSRSGLYSIT